MISQSIASPGDRILVTGSNGFIGAKVVESFWNMGLAIFVALFGPPAALGGSRSVR